MKKVAAKTKTKAGADYLAGLDKILANLGVYVDEIRKDQEKTKHLQIQIERAKELEKRFFDVSQKLQQDILNEFENYVMRVSPTGDDDLTKTTLEKVKILRQRADNMVEKIVLDMERLRLVR